MGYHLALKKKEMAQKMSITKYARVFSKKWGGQVGDTSLKHRACDHLGEEEPHSLGLMCLELKYFIAAKGITPTSSLVSAQDTWREEKVCPYVRNLQPTSHLSSTLFTGLKDHIALLTSNVEAHFPPCLHHYLHSDIQQTSAPGRCRAAHH